MPAVPTPYTWTPGSIPQATDLNAGIGAVDAYLLAVPICQLSSSSAQAVGNAIWTTSAMQWSTVMLGNLDSQWSSSANTKIYCNTPGTYRCDGSIGWTVNSTGRRLAAWFKNGSQYGPWGSVAPQASTPTVATPSVLIPMIAGDYVELHAYQESGVTLNTVAGANITFAQTQWVSQ